MTNTDLPEKRTAMDVVDRWGDGFSRLLPSHLREDNGTQWLSNVKAVLATRPEIREAAENDVNAFVAALIQAARKGLEPGTKEFHLVPFAPKKGMRRIIQGIEGYQGIIERIYRAGAVNSVIVEVVKRNDRFQWRPGIDERPQHEIDWFGTRGELLGAYAYAVMANGAISKVVVIGPDEISRAKAKAASAASPHSPWNTDPEAMWMKTAARRLENWVPTSAEYLKHRLRNAQAVAAEQDRTARGAVAGEELPDELLAAAAAADAAEDIDPVTGEVLEIVDAELVDAEPGPGVADAGEGSPAPGPDREVGSHSGGQEPTSPTANPAHPEARPDAGQPPVDAPPTASQSVDGEVASSGGEATSRPTPVTSSQKAQLRSECIRLGIQSDARLKLTFFDMVLARPEGSELAKIDDLTGADADAIITTLTGFPDRQALDAWAVGQSTLDAGDD